MNDLRTAILETIHPDDRQRVDDLAHVYRLLCHAGHGRERAVTEVLRLAAMGGPVRVRDDEVRQ